MAAALAALAALTPALLLTVRVALLAALLLAALLLLLVLLTLFLLVLLLLTALLSALILLVTHGTLLLLEFIVGVNQNQREAGLLSSWFSMRYLPVISAVFLIFVAKAEEPGGCVTVTLGTFETGAVIDARSFKLRDGREVLLAGIEVPHGAETAGKGPLERLLAGGKVTLKQADPAPDRYGRLVVQAFMPREGNERWVQGDLLATGFAQVSSRPGDASCVRALRAAEAPARQGRLGLWANSAFSVKASDDLAGLLARRGKFTVAEGKVLSVRESGGTIYINFGRVWSRNLTVTILRRNRAAFDAAGMDPKKLEGARIRVRGFIEDRTGPRMEATRPEQIEVATDERACGVDASC